jgi:exopolyphosphatase/pppGpp-phosphohydrolase
MPSNAPDIAALNATYVQAQRFTPQTQAIVVLRLGDDQSMLVWGADDQPSQCVMLPLGLSVLANRILSDGHLSELAIEQLIAEVEDIVMPLHTQLPASSKLFSEDAIIAEVAHWAGMTDTATQWSLSTDAVEQLFNRQVALAQGRPASQDHLPTTGRFSAALLVLREWLHHLHFDEITVLRIKTPDAEVLAKSEQMRS